MISALKAALTGSRSMNTSLASGFMRATRSAQKSRHATVGVASKMRCCGWMDCGGGLLGLLSDRVGRRSLVGACMLLYRGKLFAKAV